MIGTVEEAREAAARIGHLEARLTKSQGLRYLALAGTLGAIAFIAGSLAHIQHSLALFACLLVLAPAAVLMGLSSLYQLFSRRPTLVLDPEGIHHVLFGSVAWPDVVGVTLTAIRGRNEAIPVLALGLVPGVKTRGAVPWSIARGPNLRIPLLGMNQDPAPILAMAEVLRDRVSPPRLQSWFPGMSQEAVAAQLENQRLLRGFERLAKNAGRHDAGETAELRKLTEDMQHNTAELRRARDADFNRRRLQFNLLVLAMVLMMVFAVWVLFSRLAAV